MLPFFDLIVTSSKNSSTELPILTTGISLEFDTFAAARIRRSCESPETCEHGPFAAAGWQEMRTLSSMGARGPPGRNTFSRRKDMKPVQCHTYHHHHRFRKPGARCQTIPNSSVESTNFRDEIASGPVSTILCDSRALAARPQANETRWSALCNG